MLFVPPGTARLIRVHGTYNRAARIIDIMEKIGIVGPSDGVKPRRVIIENIEYGDIMKSLKAKIRNLTKDQFNRLKSLTEISKNLYNQALYTLNQEYRNTQRYLSFPQMDKIMKETVNLEGEINYRLMKAQVSQQTLKRLDNSFKGCFNALKDFASKYISRPKQPRYLKEKQHNIIYTYQSFQIKQGYAVLEKGKSEKGLSIKIPECLLYENIKQIEIIPKFKCFEAVFVYDCPKEHEQIEPDDRIMAVDLGLDNLAACTTNGIIKPFVINGRPLKSTNQLYNKRSAKLKSALDQSQPNQKWSEQLQRTTEKRNNQVNDYLHKTSNKIVSACVDNGISKIVIGNVSKFINGIKIGRRNNQNFVNISLGQLASKVKYKAELHGIEVVMADESYTSKASFLDSDAIPKKYDPENKHEFSGKRVHRGLYKSRDGILVNADVNGAYNILRKSNPEFTFSALLESVKEGIADWLHPAFVNI